MKPYSARNKVPTIQKLGEELAQRLSLQNADASKAAAGKDPEKVAKAKAASRRRVIDPTTKNEVVIQDVDGDFADSIARPKITVAKAAIDSDRAPQPKDILGVPPPHLPKGDGEVVDSWGERGKRGWKGEATVELVCDAGWIMRDC